MNMNWISHLPTIICPFFHAQGAAFAASSSRAGAWAPQVPWPAASILRRQRQVRRCWWRPRGCPRNSWKVRRPGDFWTILPGISPGFLEVDEKTVLEVVFFGFSLNPHQNPFKIHSKTIQKPFKSINLLILKPHETSFKPPLDHYFPLFRTFSWSRPLENCWRSPAGLPRSPTVLRSFRPSSIGGPWDGGHMWTLVDPCWPKKVGGFYRTQTGFPFSLP